MFRGPTLLHEPGPRGRVTCVRHRTGGGVTNEVLRPIFVRPRTSPAGPSGGVGCEERGEGSTEFPMQLVSDRQKVWFLKVLGLP